MPHDQPPVLTLDPDFLYALCLDQVQAQQRMRPPLSSLKTPDLLWSVVVSYAHALETASCVLDAMGPSAPDRVRPLVASLLFTPTPAGLYDLWRTWSRLHPDWSDVDTLQVPVYFLLCQTNCFDGLRELGRRGHALNFPVFKAYAGLEAGPVQPDEVRTQRLLNAMDATLSRTVRRHLDLTRSHDENLSPITDSMGVAIVAAVASKHRAEKRIGDLFRKGGTIPTNSGQSNEVPTIPELPIHGMNGTDERNSVWRAASHDAAFTLFAKIAPGTLGRLETALPDAAHAAQRKDREEADAKMRGGSGGRHAKKAGTEEPPVQHVPMGNLGDEENEENSPFIHPKDDHPTPEQITAAHEEEEKAKNDAEHAFRIAIDRWGASGQQMLQALAEEKTQKAAAEAAGISAPALIKRLKTLKKLLES